MLFWISFLMFNLSYLFMVLCLLFLLFVIMFGYFSSMMYLKYLIILVYVSGIVVFILYVSCMCWYQNHKMNLNIMILGFFFFVCYDSGLVLRIYDVGEYLWLYLFFSLVFSSLVNVYSLLLFKVAGSLRF